MSVPDVPLFSAIATDLPDSDHEQSTLVTGLNATRYCSLRRQEKCERRARRKESNRIQQQPLQQTKAVVHSQSDMKDTSLLSDASAQRRHSGKHSRKWLLTELEKMKKENDMLKADEGELQSKLAQVGHQREQLLADVESKSVLKSENKNLQQDVFMLKNLVVRLNVELERAQEKLHSTRPTSGDATGVLSDSGLTENSRVQIKVPVWGRSELNILAPLLQAYQETLEDKDQLIIAYRKEMEHFTVRCKAIVAENETLHQQLLEANKKGEITYTEWQSVQMEAAMTRDQNELLMRQSKLNQNKLNDVNSVYQTRINELTIDRDQTQERLSKAQAELYVMRGRCSVLTEECDHLKTDIAQKIPLSVHKAAVDECKRLFEELKHRYENERDNMTRKLAALEASRPDLDIQIVSVTAERDQLAAECKAADKSNKKMEAKLSELEERLHQSERGRESCKRQLGQAMAFARELIAEQESLVSQLAERRTVVKLGSDIAVRMNHLRSKLKGVERDACKEIDGMEHRFRQQASSLDRMKDHFKQEITRMKALLKEKDSLIQQLKLEKSQAEDQLEVVWKAAVSDKMQARGSPE